MRYSGKIGFIKTEETVPGKYEEEVTEKQYYGDVTQYRRSRRSGEGVNDDLLVNVSLSLVGDEYAYNNFYAIRYAYWQGRRWTVDSVTIERPRLELDLGGVYNGK